MSIISYSSVFYLGFTLDIPPKTDRLSLANLSVDKLDFIQLTEIRKQ